MKGKEEEARHSLSRLRGANNIEIIKNETERISTSLKMDRLNDKRNQSVLDKLTHFFRLLKDSTFIKPLTLLIVLIPIGIHWTGLAAIAYYMVPLLM